jgi:methylmalonyl-CoA/ethylmalonyl-CoA epimerase
MKKSLVFLLIGSFFTLGLTLGHRKSNALIPDKQMMQVGIIVKDVEKSAEAWASFLGLEEVPSVSLAAGSKKNPTKFKGEPTDAKAKLAFFKLDNEGEGIHHIAFDVKGMKNTIKEFEQNGIPILQHGGWDTGEYSYMDGSENLALIIELLEHYN